MFRREEIVPTVVVVLLSVVAAGGFGSTIAGWDFMTSVIIGALGAIAVSVCARRFQLLVGEAMGMSLIGFFLFGGMATAGVPTPGAYVEFADGLLNGWTEFLSSTAPVDLTAEFRALPFAITWWSIVIGTEAQRRFKHALAPLFGPGIGLVTTLLLTVGDLHLAQVQGVAIVTGALTLLVLRPGLAAAKSRSFLGAAMLVVVAVAAPVIGPRLPLATSHERFDLRHLQDRPWNPLDQPSPLATLKASLKSPRTDDVVFTVRSEKPINRWSLAVLGNYNGVVWAVAAESSDGVAEFEPVDSQLPASPHLNESQQTSTYEIEIGELGGVWLPVAGWPNRAESELSLQMSTTTGTLAAPAGLEPQLLVRMTATQRPELTTAELLGTSVPEFDDAVEVALLPPRIRNLAGDLFEGVTAGPTRATAVGNQFTANGFYDAGPAARPGHSLAQIDDFLADPDRLVGYEEQYAATAALLLRAGGVPSRVVVGYLVPDSRFEAGQAEVHANDISAWVEILTVEHGWIPLAVSPDRTRSPDEQVSGGAIQDIVIANPPTPPPPTNKPLQPMSKVDDGLTEDEDAADPRPAPRRAIPVPIVVTSVAIGTPALALAALGLIVVALKRERRRRRRSHGSPEQRVAGAWRELVDRYHELGVVIAGPTTPSEAIAAFMRAIPTDPDIQLELVQFAETLDRNAFHPEPAGREQATEAWASVQRITSDLRAKRTRWRRLVSATDPRPLAGADRHQLPQPTNQDHPLTLERQVATP